LSWQPRINSGRPLLSFPSHTAAVKFDYAPAHMRPFGGQLFVALFGDERSMTAPAGPRVGRSVARIDPQSRSLHPFITGPLVRPIDVRFHPHGETLYIVDFGYFERDAEKGVTATAFSGKLWRLKLSED
jgi:hypothetical protein